MASVLRRLDIGRFFSFLLIAVAITFALGAISFGFVFVSGALFFPLWYYPQVVSDEPAIVWSASVAYLVAISAGATIVTSNRSFVVALAAFLGVSLVAAAFVHLVMFALEVEFRAI